MPRKTTHSLIVRVEADPKTEKRFFQRLAKEMVDQMLGRPREGKPDRYTLEKRPSKTWRRPHKRGPTVNPSKEMDFSKKAVRKRETRKLVERLAKERNLDIRQMATRIRSRDFSANGLNQLKHHHGGSPFKAISEAFPELRIMPWEMARAPLQFWRKKENRVAAVKWLIRRTGKDIRQIQKSDFEEYGIAGMLQGRKVSALLIESGHVYSMESTLAHSRRKAFRKGKAYLWEMERVPRSLHSEKPIRIAMTRWLVWKSGKSPKDIKWDDFEEHGIGRMLAHCGRVPEAFLEAGYAFTQKEALAHAKEGRFRKSRLYPWEVETVNRIIKSKGIRVACVKWLLWRTGKGADELSSNDFYDNGLTSMIGKEGRTMHGLLVEAGYVHSPKAVSAHSRRGVFDESRLYPWQLANAPFSFYNERENRVAAIRWLVFTTGKEPGQISSKDFLDNGLRGIQPHFTRRGGHGEAIRDAGFDV